MSLIFDILKNLWETELWNKGVRVNLFGIPTFLYKNTRSVQASISRLKREGYLEGKSGFYVVTKKGKEYVKRKQDSLRDFDSPFSKSAPKNLLIIFDVPEEMKGEREWLRLHLKKFGYEMVQRSVWVGPSPIPKDFKVYLKLIKLDKTIRSFKLSRPFKLSK